MTVRFDDATNVLNVSVFDDGRGGAQLTDGETATGLRGLAERVRAARGTFTVSSPPTGPTIVTAVLLELGERPEISNPHQALVYLLSRELRFAKAAALWIAEHGMAAVDGALRELPGHALVLLAASPNDTAERFMARDAFWAAVMKRT